MSTKTKTYQETLIDARTHLEQPPSEGPAIMTSVETFDTKVGQNLAAVKQERAENQQAEQRSRQTRRRRAGKTLAATLLTPVAVAGTAYMLTKGTDKRLSIDTPAAYAQALDTRAASLAESRGINPDIQIVQFQFEAQGNNSLSAAIAKYAPEQDLHEAADRLRTYLPPEDREEGRVHPNQVLEFGIDTKKGEIVAKDQLLPDDTSAAEG